MNKNEAFHEEGYRGYTIRLGYDSDSGESPREWDNLGELHTGRLNNYTFATGKNDKEWSSGDDLMDYIKECKKSGAVILPVHKYEHGCILLSTSSFAGWHHAAWDSCHIGFILATAESIRKEYNVKRITKKIRERVEECLHGEIKELSQYANGDIYEYAIYKGDEYISGCGGIYGSINIEDVKDEVNDLARHDDVVKFGKIKIRL